MKWVVSSVSSHVTLPRSSHRKALIVALDFGDKTAEGLLDDIHSNPDVSAVHRGSELNG